MPADQEEIHRLSLSEYKEDRAKASVVLRYEFWSLPDKSAAWDDLHRLTSDEDSLVRQLAVGALGSAFSSIPDKSAARDDLIRLTSDEDSSVRMWAVKALGSAFSYVPDKSAAWDDLHRLTRDKDSTVRSTAASALGSAFSYVPDKSAAWDDLHRLTRDENSDVRSTAVNALGYAFSYVPDKSAAWDDLHRLTSDEYLWVRRAAAYALGSVFSYVPDKSAAWNDLHRLTSDEDSYVRLMAAYPIGSAFSYVPDKSAAWNDLHRLTRDKNSDVRMYANHSLGKICIYNASKSENEDDSKALLEDAINYFEKAVKERDNLNPATFCLLFYRSFDAVIFKRVYSKKEVDSWIAAAKREIGGSKSKKKLIEAIEQLAEALEIASDARESGGDWQETLKRCSDICNYAEHLMEENKDKAPAIHGLYKIAKPSFDKTVTELINKVKESAAVACKEARGTPAESVACLVKKETQRWDVTDQNLMAISLDLIIASLKSQIPDIPDNKGIRDQIDNIKSHTEVQYQMLILSTVISQLPTISFAAKTYETVTRTENKVDLLIQTVNELKEIASKLKEEGNKKEARMSMT